MKYRLSNRQCKECEERGRRLSIAVPLPDDWPEDGDPLRYARSVLDVPPEWVCGSEIVELPVWTGGDGLGGWLGPIHHEDGPRPEGRLVIRVMCIVSELAAVERPRHKARTQWPAAVCVDGVWRTNIGAETP